MGTWPVTQRLVSEELRGGQGTERGGIHFSKSRWPGLNAGAEWDLKKIVPLL